MRYWMFAFTVVSARSLAPLGKKVGFVIADTEEAAEKQVLDSVWNDCSCNLVLWEVFPQNGDVPNYTVYKCEV